MSGLPSGYTQLEYIQSSGTQRIDTGVQLTGYERVKIERTAKPTGQKKYRYLRMSITANRSNTNILQLSEIQIVSATGTLLTWPDGTTITASIAATSDSENVSKLIDGNTSTKFCSTAFSNSCDIDIDLGSQMLDRTEYTSWRWYTANDEEGRDPVSFELLGSVDGETYTSFDAVTSATIPTDRNALAYSGCIGVLPSNPPAAPTGLQTVLAVVLQWAASANADRYDVYRDGAKLGSTETTQYVDTTPEANQTYVYTVKAVNGGGESAGTSITVYTKSGYFEYKPLIESANFP